MQGFNKQEALTFILSKIDRRIHSELEPELDKLIGQAIDFDLAFMLANNVLDAQGNAGENYYDDDEAFEYMLDELVVLNKYSAATAMKVASLLDDYMEFQQQYLDSKGMVDWE